MTEAQRPGPEQEPALEQKVELKTPLSEFAQNSLGFVESGPMRKVRQEAIAASNNGDDGQFTNQLDRYQELVEQAVDHLTLAGVVASADIYHTAGKPSLYREEMAEAIEYASDMGLANEAQKLRELQLEIFRQDYQRGLDDFEPQIEFSLPADPFSLRSDSPTFDTLSAEELEAARQVLFAQFGITPDKEAEMVERKYESQTNESATVPGKIDVTVYKTNLEGYEGIFLQELILPDGKPSWMIGPGEDL